MLPVDNAPLQLIYNYANNCIYAVNETPKSLNRGRPGSDYWIFRAERSFQRNWW
jgi:hypothetical protein